MVVFKYNTADRDIAPVPQVQDNARERPTRRVLRFESANPAPKTPAKPRGVKRGRPSTRARSQRVDDEDDECNEDDEHDPSSTPKRTRTETLYINNVEALTKFYRRRFDEMTMKPLRKIITEWVGRLEPQRQSKYGKYDNKLPSKRSEPSPPWWPSYCPYREPSHLKREREFQASRLFASAHRNVDLIPLAADMMLVHRRIDEQCGKRKKPWITQLRSQAVYIVDSIPAETFSSSREDVFNDSMKERALIEILPSLFDVAEAHEDYVTQHELFEGSGNKDPLNGKHVTWKRCPRPYRGLPNKRTRHSKAAISAPREEPTLEESGEETEVDELMSVPSTTFSSFQSLVSSCDDDVRVKRERSPSPPLSRIPLSGPNMHPPNQISCPSQTVKAEPIATTQVAFDQSLNRLHLSETSPMDAKPSGDFQTMQFPAYGVGDPRFQTFGGISGPVPTHTPAPFQFPVWPSNIPFAHQINSLPLDGAMGNVQSTNSFQPMQAEPSQFRLPFGTPIYATNYSMPSSQPPEYGMLTQGGFGHGPSMAWDGQGYS